MYWKDLHYWGIKISRDAVTHVGYVCIKKWSKIFVSGIEGAQTGDEEKVIFTYHHHHDHGDHDDHGKLEVI